MNLLYVTLIVIGVFGSLFSFAQSPVGPTANRSPQTAPSELLDDSPAQQRIATAKRQIQANPQKVQAFNDLAIGYLKRTRETANSSFSKDAEQALAQGFKLSPSDLPLQKTEIALLLNEGRYALAKQKATALNRRTPDDVSLYGYLAEADLALGNYPEAEKSAQWMLNLLPNNVPGLLLAARLRLLYGDPEGSLELLNLAYNETSPTEIEDLAWIANQIASVQIESGKADASVAVLERAQQLFPQYPFTMENLARVRLAQHHPDLAVSLLLQAKQLDSSVHVLYDLAQAQTEAGQSAEAQASYAAFRNIAGKQTELPQNDTRDLILMEAKDTATASAALALAQKEMLIRHDVWTLDAYAWALYGNGKYADAQIQMMKALAVGIQDAQIFNHAGHIYRALKDDSNTRKYFALSIGANPSSIYASDSRRADNLPAEQADSASSSSTTAISRETSATRPSPITATVPPPPATPEKLNLATPTFPAVPPSLLTPQPTDTERIIHTAQANVTRSPKDAKTYAGLGAAYFQRARETGNVDDYQLAEQALTKSLDLVSEDFSADTALSTMAEVCMGEHRFAEALSYAQKALSLGSGDVSSFAIVGDAYADMGEYQKAGTAYDRLTPPNMTLTPRAAYARDSRLSYLKFISGDTAGAIRLMQTSVAEGIEAQLPTENLAWLYYELGEYFSQAGDVASADKAYVAALTIHPGDYRALAGLGKLRGNQGRYAEAIVFYKAAIAVVPMPIFVAELGDLYAKSGNVSESSKQYQLVAYIGLLGHINQVLHNRDLAIFYADHDIKLAEGLDLAQKEFEVRHDIYTWDALSWALYKNKRFNEAKNASDHALAFGTQDALLLFHAGMIAEKLGRRDQALSNFTKALQINPHFHAIYADIAQEQISALGAQAATY